MPLFKISHGPWEKLFSGSFQEHEIELYSNPEKILLIMVFEKKLDRIEGAIIEIYKVFHAVGEVESFTETLPRDVILLTKHDENSTMKFFLLGSKPIYSRWTEDEFIEQVDTLLKRIITSSAMIKDVSKAYELSLNEIVASEPDVQIAFFSQPLLVPLMATSAHKYQGEDETTLKSITKGEVVVGLTRDKKKVIEPLAFFTKSIVFEGTEKDRYRALGVIAESAVLSNSPVILFDWKNKGQLFGEAGNNAGELKKYQVELDPFGFPIKLFKPGKSIFIDVNLMSPEGIAEIFKIGDKNFPKLLAKILAGTKFESMQKLIDSISATKSEEFTEYEVMKTARLMKLIDSRYKGIFGGQNNIDDLTNKGRQSFARLAIIDMSTLDHRAGLLLAHSVVKGVTKKFESASAGNINTFFIVPDAYKIVSSESDKISGEIAATMSKMSKNGVGFALESENQIDLNQSVVADFSAEVNIVSSNDVSVQLKGKKGYRVLVRPLLSKAE
ncbi:MAG: hypothetical protein COV47_04310 [Candidatus Diapherotrites archaeon CG11_big_fil_rev_8_21_14_0_20_37_9]|nr:MAG: hypothetical protein COV47_04310 [Candidatus Diapherotrites archaeon CG11_big_fil_rev_8_21_14_0_20_37_9]